MTLEWITAVITIVILAFMVEEMLIMENKRSIHYAMIVVFSLFIALLMYGVFRQYDNGFLSVYYFGK